MAVPIELELYVSRHCPHCNAALEMLAPFDKIRGRPVVIRRRDVLEHLDSAVAAGVRATPALALNGRLIAYGRLTPDRLHKILDDALTGEPNNGAHDR